MIDFLLGVPGKLKAISAHLTTNVSSVRMALIDNWTLGRAQKLDLITVAPAPASTALTNTTWTNALAAKMLAQSRFITNPKHMPLRRVEYSGVTVRTGLTAVVSSNNDLSAALAPGGSIASISAINTFVTVCNLSGGGFLTHVMSASAGTGTGTLSIRITVDGTVYTITSPSFSASGNRVFLGAVLDGPQQVATGTGITMGIGGGNDSGFTSNGGTPGYLPFSNNMGTLILPTPAQVLANNLPALRFESSLLVEIAASTLNSTAYNRVGYAGYVMDI